MVMEYVGADLATRVSGWFINKGFDMLEDSKRSEQEARQAQPGNTLRKFIIAGLLLWMFGFAVVKLVDSIYRPNALKTTDSHVTFMEEMDKSTDYSKELSAEPITRGFVFTPGPYHEDGRTRYQEVPEKDRVSNK